MSFERRTLLVALALVAPACSHQKSAAASQPTSTSVSAPVRDEQSVAEIDGLAVPASELEDRVRARLARLKQEEYEIRKQGLDALIGDRLIDAEAKRRGVTRDALLRAEVEGKVQKPTAAEVDKVYEQIKPRLGGRTRQQAGPDIEQSIMQQGSGARREAFIQSLRSSARIVLHLSPPRSEVSIPATAPAFGPSDAAVTIVGFSDFQCPYCHRAQATMDKVVATYGKRVRLIHRDFPLEGHTEATPAARAARCAGEQKKFWEYHRGLMTEPGDLTAGDLAARAKRLGLDETAFGSCLASDRHAAEVKKDVEDGTLSGVSGTPTYFVNGRMITGARPFEAFAEIIDAELAVAGK